jgi:hypothetical protein
MEKVCPVCNAIYEPKFLCENCKEPLKEKGRISDFFDPYSADMPIENENEGYCCHVYSCDKCKEEFRYRIKCIHP